MKSRYAKTLGILLAVIMLISAFAGCGAPEPKLPAGAAENDILTFKNNAENKPIIHVGMQYYSPDTHLEDALEEAFPDYLFVLDYSLAAGTGSEKRMLYALEHGPQFDMLVSGGKLYAGMSADDFVDLSAESFLDNYLLSALNNVSHEGHIYFLPGVSQLIGIAYNADMFAQNGWEVPKDTEELFALFETIRAAGTDPLSNCYKYANQVANMFGTMCYDKLYASAEDAAWLGALQRGEATYTGHMEPFYELAKRFYDNGIGSIEEFSASLTEQRQEFWAGEHAMIFYNTNIFNFAEAENAPFEVGIMPFPTENSSNTGYATIPAYYISLPKSVEDDPERLALMKDVLAFLSSPEGQKAMLGDSISVSNVKGVDMADSPAFKYVQEAYERGNLYPAIEYPLTDVPIPALQQASIKTIFEGASAEDAIASMDASLAEAFAGEVEEPEPEKLAEVEEDFTMLETSYYIADKFRETTGADIGFMIDGGYFRSNLAELDKGEVTTDLRRFVMKGVGAEEYLTTYKMTGAQIKEFLEHPIVNKEEIDALVASSGLIIEYAPWNERGSRVLSVTLEDGSELADDEVFTVAAWFGVIEEGYITETVKAYDDLGDITEILHDAFKRDGTVAPNIAGRVTLVWPEIK